MKFKTITFVLAMALVSAVVSGRKIRMKKSGRKPARWQPKPCRICRSWNPVPKQLFRKRRHMPFR